MPSFTSIFSAVLLAAAAVSAVPAVAEAEVAAVEKRTGYAIVHSTYRTTDCNNPIFLGWSLAPGTQCQDIAENALGAEVYNPNSSQNCVIKYWSNTGCTGNAKSFYVPTNANNNHCFRPNHNAGSTDIGTVRSVSVNCAVDNVRSA